MTHAEWHIVRESDGLAIARTDDGRYYTVVRVDRQIGQVSSWLPQNRPAGGGAWFARLGSAGIAYVSSPVSRATAYRHFRRAQDRDAK